MASAAVARTPRVNYITGLIVRAAMKVHSALGPGLLESAYETCLAHELGKAGLHFHTQVGLPVVYDGAKIDLGYLGLLVEDLVIVEIKYVEAINPVHEAELLSYMRLSGHNVALLINFHVAHLRNGIKRNGRWQKLGKMK